MLQQATGQGVTKIEFTRQAFFSKTYQTKINIAPGLIATERFVSEEDEWANSPFDTIIASNLDSVDLALQLDNNPENLLVVKAGQTVGIDNQKLRNFTLLNMDAVNDHTAGMIKITLQNTVTPRKL